MNSLTILLEAYPTGIFKIITDSAKEHGLNEWDWVAISISTISFVISCVTLYFTTKTYKSQLKTQKNTTPMFSKESQAREFEVIFGTLIGNYARALAIKRKCRQLKYQKYPSEFYLKQMLLNTDNLHFELFYDNPIVTFDMNRVQSEIATYNNGIDIICKHLADKSISKDVKDKEFTHIMLGLPLSIIIFMNRILIKEKMIDYAAAPAIISFLKLWDRETWRAYIVKQHLRAVTNEETKKKIMKELYKVADIDDLKLCLINIDIPTEDIDMIVDTIIFGAFTKTEEQLQKNNIHLTLLYEQQI